MAYYKRLREWREDHDISQRTLAKVLGLTQPQYCRYEQGYCRLSAEQVNLRLSAI
jgi:transcriptional regulator with XRE-family HTH domain